MSVGEGARCCCYGGSKGRCIRRHVQRQSAACGCPGGGCCMVAAVSGVSQQRAVLHFTCVLQVGWLHCGRFPSPALPCSNAAAYHGRTLHSAGNPRVSSCPAKMSMLDSAFLFLAQAHWPGSELRLVSGGHVSAFLMHQDAFRAALRDSLARVAAPPPATVIRSQD